MQKATFFNSKDGDRKYNAADWANYFKPLFVSGVFNGDLSVSAGTGMQVVVATGYAWLEGYGYNNTEDLVIDLEESQWTNESQKFKKYLKTADSQSFRHSGIRFQNQSI